MLTLVPQQPPQAKMPIPIIFVKRVVFSDSADNVLKVYEVGDLAFATFDTGHYYVLGWGGIYHDEAERV